MTQTFCASHSIARRHLAAIVALVVCAGISSPSASDTPPDEPAWLTQLHELESASARANRRAEKARKALSRTRKELTEQTKQLELARKAKDRVLTELNRYTATLHKQKRALKRHVGSNRTARTFRIVQDRALRSRKEDIQFIDESQNLDKKVLELIHQRGQKTVHYARHKARHSSARTGHDALLEEAKKPEHRSQLERQLRAATEKMGEHLKALEAPSGGAVRDFHRYKGTLHPPVDQYPDFPFRYRGKRPKATLILPYGQAWRLNVGTDIESIGAGRVAYTGYFVGYGHTVIVAHGKRYHAVYAHLSKTKLEPGDPVDRDQKIGEVGSSGSLVGPLLYLELRKNGRPLNPGSWYVRQ